MKKTLIIGFGKAGRDLHLATLQKAHIIAKEENVFDNTIGIVDPYVSDSNIKGVYPRYSRLVDVRGFEPESTVIHVCTDPANHYSVIRQALLLGYRQFIVEKPLVLKLEELEQLLALENQCPEFDILVVSNWLFSSLTAQIKILIDSGKLGSLQRLTMKQDKPRFSRTLANHGHKTAFDVEIPHQIALALYLAGLPIQIKEAEISDMVINDITIPHMGKVRIDMAHPNNINSSIRSNLTSPQRIRQLELMFEESRIVGYFPCSSDDLYSRLIVYDANRKEIMSELFEDNQLLNCLTTYYRYFVTKQNKPVSDLSFNAKVVSLIYEAKKLCGI